MAPNGMFTMQNVVTVASCASAISSPVGTPQVGQEPRGGTYTFVQRGQRLLHHPRALHREIDDAGAVHAEHDTALQRRGGVVQVEDRVARTLQRFDRALNQLGARLTQHLNRHVRRNAVFVDDAPGNVAGAEAVGRAGTCGAASRFAGAA